MVEIKDPFSQCNINESSKAFSKSFMYGFHDYYVPFYFAFGLVGCLLNLLTLYVQWKKETAYLPQVFVGIIETMDVISLSLYLAGHYVWSGVLFRGQKWFMKCYICMFLDSYFTNPVQMMSQFCTALLSLCMTLDRIYALAWPTRYMKRGNAKLIHWITFVFSIIFSTICSFMAAFFNYPEWDEIDQVYYNRTNFEWLPIIFKVLSVHGFLRLAMSIGLIVSDIGLALMFKYRMKKRAMIKNQSSKEARETQKMRTLFWLTFVQCTFSGLSGTSEFIYQILAWLQEIFHLPGLECINERIGSWIDLSKSIGQVLGFYLLFALMPSFRRMVISALKYALKIQNNQVSVISQTGN